MQIVKLGSPYRPTFFLFFVFFSAMLTRAPQQALASGGPPPSSTSWQWQIQQDFLVEPEISFKDSQAELSLWSAQTKLSLTRRLGRKLSLGWRLNFEHYGYGSQTSSPGLIQEPGSDSQLFRLRTGPFLRVQWSERWSTIAQILPDLSAAYGVSGGESFQMSSLLLGAYRLSPRWSLSLGALILAPRIDDSVLVVPILGFDYRLSERLRLGLGEGQSGPGFYLYHGFRPRWTVKLNLDWSLREFRLSRESPLASGIFEDMSVPLRLGLEWQAPRQWKIEPFVGARLWSRFEYFNAQGKSLDVDTAYPSFFLGLTFKKTIDF